jgi:hypothetical protein
MKKIEEITFKVVSDDVEDYLKSIGFREIKWGVWVDILERHEIHLKGDGIYCYTSDRGSVYDGPYLEMHINFIPHTTVLNYLLKGIHFIN